MEGGAEAQARSADAMHPSARSFSGTRALSLGGHPSDSACLQFEYPCGTEQPLGGSLLLPLDSKLLKEFWSIKEVSVPSASGDHVHADDGCDNAASYRCELSNAPSWGRAQLQPSRLSRSVSAQEFNANVQETCVRAGVSGKGDSKVRHGRRSSAVSPACARSVQPTAEGRLCKGEFVNGSSWGLLQACSDTETRWSSADQSFAIASVSGEGECQQHGVRATAMDRRVHGGRLLRSQLRENQRVSVLSLLEPSGPHMASQSPSGASLRGRASIDLDSHGHVCRNGGGLGRLSSLDAATLHQLDRALSGAAFEPGALSPRMEAVSSSTPVGGALSRVFKVRPMGNASSLSLYSAAESSFSRTSTLLDLAEEATALQQLHSLPTALGRGGAQLAASVSGRFNYLALVSGNNSTCAADNASAASSAAMSLSASPNAQQPHISLAALMGAASTCMSNGGGLAVGRGGFATAGHGMGSVVPGMLAGGSMGGSGGGAAPPLAHRTSDTTTASIAARHSGAQSLPDDRGCRGPSLGAPDMRMFPFSSPEDFYMAATVLLEAQLPCVPTSAGLSPPSSSPFGCDDLATDTTTTAPLCVQKDGMA